MKLSNSKSMTIEQVEAFLTALDVSSIVSISDPTGKILSINELFTKTLGFTPEEVVGKNYRFLNSSVHDKDFFKSLWGKVLSKQIWMGEICNRSKFGEFYWLKTTIIPILNTEGELVQFITIRQDITELKNQQEENWKQLQFQASINKSTNNIIIRCEMDGVINYVNSAFEKLIGYDSDEIIGYETPLFILDREDIVKKTVDINLQFNVEKIAGIDTLFFKTNQGIKNEMEWKIIPKSKNKTIISFAINHILDQDQVPVGYILVGTDVTQKRIIEEKLEEVKKDAELTLKIKNDFMSRLSHEIKTPLNGILGMTELMEQTEINSEQKDYLETIQKSSYRLLSLINKTVEYSKVEHGAFDINERRFSISEELKTLESYYSNLCESKKIGFSLNNKLGHDFFHGDDKRIFQVINYYLENAVRFTSKGNVSLTISLAENDEVLFEVRDTGSGVDSERGSNLFKPFVFEKFSIQDDFNGLGLSLAIADRIAVRLGGKVGFKSSLGHGSLFWIKVPLINADSLDENLSKDNHFKVPSNLLKVLIVEDDLINQKLLKKMLNKLNVFPEVVSNGLEAIELQQSQKFNLIFMDINMPVMDGFEATKKMRKKSVVYGSPYIVAVTANSVTGDEELCLQAGMDSYISKPINRDQLEKLVISIVGIDSDEQPLKAPKSKRKLKFYIEKIVEDFKGDEEILNEFVGNFIQKVPSKIASLEKAIKENEFEVIRNESHLLKDLVGSFYQEELRKRFERFEHYGKDKTVRNIYPMYVDLKIEMDQLLEELENQFIKKAV